MCNVGSCSKAAGAVVRVWLKIHAKEEEKLHAGKSDAVRIYTLLT
jgi:hypothetical protein